MLLIQDWKMKFNITSTILTNMSKQLKLTYIWQVLPNLFLLITDHLFWVLELLLLLEDILLIGIKESPLTGKTWSILSQELWTWICLEFLTLEQTSALLHQQSKLMNFALDGCNLQHFILSQEHLTQIFTNCRITSKLLFKSQFKIGINISD